MKMALYAEQKVMPPQIDGNIFIDKNFKDLKQGQLINVLVEESNEYDLWGGLIK